MLVLRTVGEKMATCAGICGAFSLVLLARGIWEGDFSQKDIHNCAKTLGPVAVRMTGMDGLSEQCLQFGNALRTDEGDYKVPNAADFPVVIEQYELDAHRRAAEVELALPVIGGVLGGGVGLATGLHRRRELHNLLNSAVAETS